MPQRKVILYIASSIDGKIARENGDVDWLSTPELTEGQDYGYSQFNESIDTVVMGYATYAKSLDFGEQAFQGQHDYCVFTREHEEESLKYATPISQSPVEFISGLRQSDGKNIWLMGGGKLIASFLADHLIDEMMVFVIPVVLGSGIPLFVNSPEISAKLLTSETYATGVQLLHYQLRADAA